VVNVATAATARAKAERLLDLETGAAWFEYLERTRSLPAHRYDELEPWAWQLLQERLRALRRRRERLSR
jgi:hypothetical protein